MKKDTASNQRKDQLNDTSKKTSSGRSDVAQKESWSKGKEGNRDQTQRNDTSYSPPQGTEDRFSRPAMDEDELI